MSTRWRFGPAPFWRIVHAVLGPGAELPLAAPIEFAVELVLDDDDPEAIAMVEKAAADAGVPIERVSA